MKLQPLSILFSDVAEPRRRYTLEEIALRYAMSKGVSYASVLESLRNMMDGAPFKEVS